MIGPAYVRTMARYNRWQNASLYAAADTLSDEARRQDRGAFFRSIHATLNHLQWADTMWMSRFSDVSREARTVTPRNSGVGYRRSDWSDPYRDLDVDNVRVAHARGFRALGVPLSDDHHGGRGVRS